jgi:hypothetical protein
VRALASLLILSTLGGCTLFESLPDRTCKASSDCFQAQGEMCDPDKKVCVAGPDAHPLTSTTTSVDVDQAVAQ